MIEQHIVYRHQSPDVAQQIAAHRQGDVVTCTDLDTGAALGEYVLDGNTLSGTGELSEILRQGVAAELHRCRVVEWTI